MFILRTRCGNQIRILGVRSGTGSAGSVVQNEMRIVVSLRILCTLRKFFFLNNYGRLIRFCGSNEKKVKNKHVDSQFTKYSEPFGANAYEGFLASPD